MKAITIEKGKVAFYSSLSADTLVVNGVLKVNGTLKVRRLLGRGCQRQFEIVRKRRRNFVVFRRGGGNKTKRFLAQKECSRFAVSDA